MLERLPSTREFIKLGETVAFIERAGYVRRQLGQNRSAIKLEKHAHYLNSSYRSY
jgi:hypothetical protein